MTSINENTSSNNGFQQFFNRGHSVYYKAKKILLFSSGLRDQAALDAIDKVQEAFQSYKPDQKLSKSEKGAIRNYVFSLGIEKREDGTRTFAEQSASVGEKLAKKHLRSKVKDTVWLAIKSNPALREKLGREGIFSSLYTVAAETIQSLLGIKSKTDRLISVLTDKIEALLNDESGNPTKTVSGVADEQLGAFLGTDIDELINGESSDSPTDANDASAPVNASNEQGSQQATSSLLTLVWFRKEDDDAEETAKKSIKGLLTGYEARRDTIDNSINQARAAFERPTYSSRQIIDNLRHDSEKGKRVAESASAKIIEKIVRKSSNRQEILQLANFTEKVEKACNHQGTFTEEDLKTLFYALTGKEYSVEDTIDFDGVEGRITDSDEKHLWNALSRELGVGKAVFTGEQRLRGFSGFMTHLAQKLEEGISDLLLNDQEFIETIKGTKQISETTTIDDLLKPRHSEKGDGTSQRIDVLQDHLRNHFDNKKLNLKLLSTRLYNDNIFREFRLFDAAEPFVGQRIGGRGLQAGRVVHVGGHRSSEDGLVHRKRSEFGATRAKSNTQSRSNRGALGTRTPLRGDSPEPADEEEKSEFGDSDEGSVSVSSIQVPGLEEHQSEVALDVSIPVISQEELNVGLSEEEFNQLTTEVTEAEAGLQEDRIAQDQRISNINNKMIALNLERAQALQVLQSLNSLGNPKEEVIDATEDNTEHNLGGESIHDKKDFYGIDLTNPTLESVAAALENLYKDIKTSFTQQEESNEVVIPTAEAEEDEAEDESFKTKAIITSLTALNINLLETRNKQIALNTRTLRIKAQRKAELAQKKQALEAYQKLKPKYTQALLSEGKDINSHIDELLEGNQTNNDEDPLRLNNAQLAALLGKARPQPKVEEPSSLYSVVAGALSNASNYWGISSAPASTNDTRVHVDLTPNLDDERNPTRTGSLDTEKAIINILLGRERVGIDSADENRSKTLETVQNALKDHPKLQFDATQAEEFAKRLLSRVTGIDF